MDISSLTFISLKTQEQASRSLALGGCHSSQSLALCCCIKMGSKTITFPPKVTKEQLFSVPSRETVPHVSTTWMPHLGPAGLRHAQTIWVTPLPRITPAISRPAQVNVLPPPPVPKVTQQSPLRRAPAGAGKGTAESSLVLWQRWQRATARQPPWAGQGAWAGGGQEASWGREEEMLVQAIT